MAKYTNLSSLFTAIADAIRTKKGLAAGTKIVADNFPDEIAGITTGITPSGKIDITTNGEHDVTNYAKANVKVSADIPSTYADVSGVTATKADVLSTVKFVDKNGKLDSGSITNGALNSTMEFDVDESTGIVTATASVKTSGYLAIGKSTSDSEQLTTNSGGTWTPSATTSRSIEQGTFLTGKLTLANEPNLIASNIKKGVSIYGVSGTYEVSSGSTTSSNGLDYYYYSTAIASAYNDCFEFDFTVPVTGTYNVKLLHLSIFKNGATANCEILSFQYDIYTKRLRIVSEDSSGDIDNYLYDPSDWEEAEVYVDETFYNGSVRVRVGVIIEGDGDFDGYVHGIGNPDHYTINAVFGEVIDTLE